ncbi:hypothetical protein MSNKSG1_03011 [Marinobacter santoriniensis NKSG1]|uniref:DUF1853 domain-containing protein n=1 Tax=Marinobacter santoriniensis NKSG1 TaxID=1288826 RepID=M7CXP3_9GAMM|nr:DUF1853 family protein [Marinobacter santoriniensis]EMP56995.1 hypothetical protein MSNKSG1_03011 [Marinobacter santoriniensis NKSG1]
MSENTDTCLLLPFRHPAVRHLAWTCTAPQLLHCSQSFEPARHLPTNYPEILRDWDHQPERIPKILTETPPRRLGFYFERLYESLLTDLLGWEILLKNQQVQTEGRTLGELDFVVFNRNENRIEHHEIAIKFYLGVPGHDGPDRWYGPNARDRLDLKTDRLLNQQTRLTRRPETRHLLAQRGIATPLVSRVFMPGYLFYPDNRSIDISVPSTTPVNHLHGTWHYASQILQADIARCVPLHKPHWIGPWIQTTEPDPAAAEAALSLVIQRNIPQLFAELDRDSASGAWTEQRRFFLVPDSWPANA